MARKFLDTSAVVKLHHTEPDSEAVQALFDVDNDVLLISRITLLEFRSALLGCASRKFDLANRWKSGRGKGQAAP